MNTYTLQTEIENTNLLWENFEEYMNQIYFDGATELLDKKLVAFEYHQYMETFVA